MWGLFTKNKSDLYIFVPWGEHHTRIEEAIKNFGYHGNDQDFSSVEFEWGRIPGSETWLFADDQDLSLFVDPKMRQAFVSAGTCPRCGDSGYWKALAIFCPWHGRFL